MEKVRFQSKNDGIIIGNSEAAALVRSFDWASSPLGPIEAWSESLRITVNMLLSNRFPMLLWWGPEYVCIYNDAYSPILGTKHPLALGQPVKSVWSEIWDVLKPLIDTPYKGGPSSWLEDLQVEINRNGFMEETHFLIAYSPAPDDTEYSRIGGVLATVTETTEKVLSERRVNVLSDLGLHATDAKTKEAACVLAAETLGKYPNDIPFALFYVLDPGGHEARLAGSSGLKTGEAISPVIIASNTDAPDALPYFEAIRTGKIQLVNDLANRFDYIPNGPWADPPSSLAIIPVPSNNPQHYHGFIVAGLSSRLQFNESYKNFLQLLTSQVAISMSNASALEEERKRTEALEQIDKSKTVFFTNISHEFRTPLTLMLGPLEELLSKQTTLNDAEKQNIETSYRNALRLLKLVNSLLDFSRIEAGRQTANFSEVNLAALTSDLASNFRSVIERAGLHLKIETEDIVEPAYVDNEMWEKIIFNLLSNAFKSTLKGEITVRLNAENSVAILQVSDTGIGIPKKELSKMFDRFHRVENTVARTYEGTGIGLSLVKELVRLHQGTIDVESELGVGSTFTIRIPLGRGHFSPQDKITDAQRPADKQSPLRYNTKQFIQDVFIEEANALIDGDHIQNQVSLDKDKRPLVMIVDDNADMREYLNSLLSKDFKIILANNGLDALDKMQNNEPALVLSDVMMPRMNGLELLKEIKNNNRTEAIPVVLLTARAGEESKIEGWETGADDYLIKPFSAKELLARVNTNIKNGRIRKEALRNLERLFKHAPVEISVLQGNPLRYVQVNDAALEGWKKKYEDVINKVPQEVFPNFVRQGFGEILNGVIETGLPYFANEDRIEVESDAEKSIRYCNYVVQPVKNDEGVNSGLLITGVDVTETVNARKRIEESREQLNEMADAMPQLVWIADETGKIIYYNNRISEFANPENPNTSGLYWHELIHPDDQMATQQSWQAAVKSGAEYDIEHRIKMKDGYYRWFLSRAHPQKDSESRIIKWFGTATDIDVQKLHEIRKDDFIKMASHELKTPITTIKGYFQILQEKFRNSEEKDLQYSFGILERQLNKLTKLVSDLLDVTRIESGRLVLEKSDFSLDELIRETTAEMQTLSKNHKILFESNENVVVHADKDRITQVLVNLVTNAIKYSPDSDNVVITMRSGIGQVIVGVRDFGIGVEEGEQRRIFENFYRVKKKDEQTFPGFGIGLYIVSEIMKQHEGEVWVESDPGKGSVFYFSLPLVAGC